MIGKMTPLAIFEILVAFVNTLTVHERYPLQNFENLRLPIQMKLSEKKETFSQFFVPFLKFLSNYKHFEENEYDHN